MNGEIISIYLVKILKNVFHDLLRHLSVGFTDLFKEVSGNIPQSEDYPIHELAS